MHKMLLKLSKVSLKWLETVKKWPKTVKNSQKYDSVEKNSKQSKAVKTVFMVKIGQKWSKMVQSSIKLPI